MTEWERLTLAASRLAAAWVEFWDALRAYEDTKRAARTAREVGDR